MYAAIMAGGRGTRFWPLSRSDRPKQILPILGPRTMIQMTVDRTGEIIPPDKVLVITGARMGARVREQLPHIPAENIVEEPFGRGTAAAVGLAAKIVEQREPGSAMVVLPSDHLITGERFFRAQVEAAGQAVKSLDLLVTFGIRPTRPDTGYGYIETLNEVLGEENGFRFHRVARFHEKPDLETAQEYIQSEDFYWNSGIFVFSSRFILEKIESLIPELGRALAMLEGSPGHGGFEESLAGLYSGLPHKSIDHGVMEHSPEVATLPADFGWSDLGSWESLYEVLEKDDRGHAKEGEVVDVSSADCLVRGGKRPIVLVGVEGLAVVDTDDALLICSLNHSQEVRDAVEELVKKGREDLL